jgi:glutamate 5-kinase
MSGPIVMKLGSNLVVGPDRRPHQEIIEAVTAEVSELVQQGALFVVVSSGAR